MEITYAGFNDTLSTLSSLSSSKQITNANSNTENTTNCNYNATIQVQSSKLLEPTTLTPPIPKRYKGQLQKFVKRITNNHHNTITSNNNHTNNTSPNPFLNPYETSNAPLSKTHCISCGKYPPEDSVKPYSGTPLTQYGLENVVTHVCQPCLIGQGVLRHVLSIMGLYVSDAHERVALVNGLKLMNDLLQGDVVNNDDSNYVNVAVENGCGGKGEVGNDGNYHRMEELNTKVKKLLHHPSFAACRHRSRTLDHICNQLSDGEIVPAEFIDKLNEYANDAIGKNYNKSDDDDNSMNNNMISSISSSGINETIQMKKEALMVAGDMRAAIEMLQEHALPKNISGSGYSVGASASKGGTEMLSCVLEFFLDLCEQGELKSVAFFWTQICQIHTQMLPPTDIDSLIRVELVEDFLLTVCIKYSVHLALELVWSCLADLEESIGSGNLPSASCRRRRFAMLRFVCELESLVFDMEGGWGGGNVSLRGMYSPSDQQTMVIKDAMEILQLHRRFSSHHLTRSARLDKLRMEAQGKVEERIAQLNADDAVMDAAERKYQIARNAEYFSTQLMFCRRLGDVAERLFFMDVDERKDALRGDLDMLNASGRLGGDPLNKICDASNGLVNVMNIPSNEGHVFRSKERTPVLLLMEIISDQKIFENTPNSPKKNLPKEDYVDEDQHPESEIDKRTNISNQVESKSTMTDNLENGDDLENTIFCDNEMNGDVDLLGMVETSDAANKNSNPHSDCCK